MEMEIQIFQCSLLLNPEIEALNPKTGDQRPKSGEFGSNPESTVGNHNQNTFLSALSVKPRFSWWAVGLDALKQLVKYISFFLYTCIYKTAREVATSPIPPRYAPFPIATIFWHVGSGGGRASCNQPCQLLSKSAQGLCPPRRSKLALPHWLDVSPLQHCKH